MAGTREGGKKTAETNNTKTEFYSEGNFQEIEPGSYYREIGAKGGRAKNPNKGFGSNRELASEAGRRGGTVSRKTPYSDRFLFIDGEQPIITQREIKDLKRIFRWRH